MVDGVHGHILGHAVRHVVVEHKDGLDYVTILHLLVMEMIVVAVMLTTLHATPIAVLVRKVMNMTLIIYIYIYIYIYMHI